VVSLVHAELKAEGVSTGRKRVARLMVSVRERPPCRDERDRDAAQLSRLCERGYLHSMGRMTLITGDERRRRWSSEERARILAAIEEPGAVVAEVARRADVCTSLVYKWRLAARAAASASGFVQVIVENPQQPPARASEAELGAILVEMNGARIRIGANAPSALIVATLKVLRS
jgi:transposase